MDNSADPFESRSLENRKRAVDVRSDVMGRRDIGVRDPNQCGEVEDRVYATAQLAQEVGIRDISSLISRAEWSTPSRKPTVDVELYASSTMTSAPSERSASTRCDPIKPQPPVTSTRRRFQKSPVATARSG